MTFKKEFFYHVKNIDSNISNQHSRMFRESVIFISNYAPVSVERIFNYAMLYPIGIYEQDRVKWIEWYDQNKCNNIQFKDSYIIPDAYK